MHCAETEEGAVDSGLVAARAGDGALELVGDPQRGGTAEVLHHVDVRIDPVRQLLGLGRLAGPRPGATSAATTTSGWTSARTSSRTGARSLIVEPPDGRIPALSEEGSGAPTSGAYREAHPADSYLDRSAFDRCILGFNTGPPMTPGFYNQNMRLFQTPDHVVVLNDLVHD